MLTAETIAEALGLQPLPAEGGLYRRTFEAEERVSADALPPRYGREKRLSTAIYYLLTNETSSFSALHRLPTEEIYHFYLGDPVELLQLFSDGSSETVVLGQDLSQGQRVQHVVPRGAWQGSLLVGGGRFALMGATMAPGYDDLDYEGGVRAELISSYPDRVELIQRLTRVP